MQAPFAVFPPLSLGGLFNTKDEQINFKKNTSVGKNCTNQIIGREWARETEAG